MYKLVLFIKKYQVVLLFILLETGAIIYYANSSSYTRARLLAASNTVVGGVHGLFASIGDYFTLKRDNRQLAARLAEVENELSLYRAEYGESIDGDHVDNKYFYSMAKVVNNTITRQNNYFVIDKGWRDGVEENMVVLSVNGAVAGYVQDCSARYAVCMSVLNTDFRVGGKVNGSEYFGSVYWNGITSDMVTLQDIPKYAPVSKGDSIVTAYSSRFPAGTYIGTVESYKETDTPYYEIEVRLAAGMEKLSDVMLVKYRDAEELNNLMEKYFPEK